MGKANGIKEFKVTKLFKYMTRFERLTEGAKMYLFLDTQLGEYYMDCGFYTAMAREYENTGDECILDSLNSIRLSLINKQRLFVKYNMEDMIYGLEVVKSNTTEYERLIEPYKPVRYGYFHRVFFGGGRVSSLAKPRILN